MRKTPKIEKSEKIKNFRWEVNLEVIHVHRSILRVLSSPGPEIADTTRDTGLKPFYSDSGKQTNRLEWSATSYVGARLAESREN